MTTTLKFFIWNIGNPSLERAKKQCELFINYSADIFVLTETKNSDGCKYIKDFFESNNFFIDYKIPANRFDYGVIIASKIKFLYSNFIDSCTYLLNRISSINIVINNKKLDIISLYVPSRDSSKEKILRKKSFLTQILSSLENNNSLSNTILCGDFNILEKSHIPHYSSFRKWEYDFYDNLVHLNFIDCFKYKNPNSYDYSWFGKNGNGYRYDYIFCNNSLVSSIHDCYFFHQPRIDKLSDHSVLIFNLTI